MNEITVEKIEELIQNKSIGELRSVFEEYNSVDLAELINMLDVKKTIFIFNLKRNR